MESRYRAIATRETEAGNPKLLSSSELICAVRTDLPRVQGTKKKGNETFKVATRAESAS